MLPSLASVNAYSLPFVIAVYVTQCISVWYNNATNQDCKALQRVVRLAERISGSALPSLQDIYFKRCKSRAAKIIKTQITPVTIFSVYCHLAGASGAWWQRLKDWGGASSLRPSGSLTQTLFHKHLQDPLLTVNILTFSLLLLYVQYPEQPVCTSLLFTLLFIKSQYTVFLFLHILLFFAHLVVFCTSYCFLHILLFCTFFISLHILLLFLFFYHMYALVLCYFI